MTMLQLIFSFLRMVRRLCSANLLYYLQYNGKSLVQYISNSLVDSRDLIPFLLLSDVIRFFAQFLVKGHCCDVFMTS